MDLEKAIQLVTEHGSRYLHAFVRTLVRPGQLFAPVEADGALVRLDHSGETRVNPELFVFVLLSIVIGVTLGSVLPGVGAPSAPFGSLLPVVFVMWLLFGTGVHMLARLLGGRATYVETSSVTLQVLGVVYVLCNAGALGARALEAGLNLFERTIGGPVAAELAFYLPVQFGLLFVYIPLAVRSVHRLKAGSATVALVLGSWIGVAVAIGGLMYVISGIRCAAA